MHHSTRIGSLHCEHRVLGEKYPKLCHGSGVVCWSGCVGAVAGACGGCIRTHITAQRRGCCRAFFVCDECVCVCVCEAETSAVCNRRVWDSPPCWCVWC